MNRIANVELAAAPEVVRTTLAAVAKGLGGTPNLFLVAARSPAALEAMTGLFGATGKGRLSAADREAIALAVSEINRCDYCLSAHSALGARAGLDASAMDAARGGESSLPKRSALLGLARRLVEARGRVSDAEVAAARAAGVTDEELLEVVANVALTTFTNYVNELAQTEIDFPVVRHAAR